MATIKLRRDDLTLVRLVQTVDDALAKAGRVRVDVSAAVYANAVLVLLPAHARDRAEEWMPSASAPEDEWARLGAYRGALDGRRQAPVRDEAGCSPTRARVYASAYSAAYMLASVRMGVRHG